MSFFIIASDDVSIIVNILYMGSIILELQNRVAHYDVTTEFLTLKVFLKFFELVTRCEINFKIILELVTRDL